MEFATRRYKFSVQEINKGGPAGYESTYLSSEGSPASSELYSILENYKGKLLAAESLVVRQRNGQALASALADWKPVGIASGFKPSGAYHFGHKLTSESVAFFQKNGVQVFVPVADIECAMDPRQTEEQYQFWAADNLLDWGANGVDLDAAHVYLQSEEFRVNMLSYIVARSLKFDFAVDIYGAEKLVDDFPFLFAGITQVGDILLPQHRDFGNFHSFMVSGQDQDGHMKMTTALAQATLDNGTDLLGVHTIPSGLYIPHIRGIKGDKASSSRAEGTLYLGAGPNIEDLVERTRSSLNKIEGADRDHLERCSLDMVRYLDVFNRHSRVSFAELCAEPEYLQLTEALNEATNRDDQMLAQSNIDAYLIQKCMDLGQDNVTIVRETLPEALAEHQQKREAVLIYARTRSQGSRSNDVFEEENPYGTEPLKRPEFWDVPSVAAVNESQRNPTQWFSIINRAASQIQP